LNPPSLPGPVARFIEEHIHSVLQLEILLLLREHVGEWTPARVASELRITEQSAELHLADLSLRGLISVESATRSYVYAPRTPELSAVVDELASCYANMRYTIINLIFAVPGDSARTLAEAFRFRRKREN
jgi:predicted DNA-binding transcriptional regulator